MTVGFDDLPYGFWLLKDGAGIALFDRGYRAIAVNRNGVVETFLGADRPWLEHDAEINLYWDGAHPRRSKVLRDALVHTLEQFTGQSYGFAG